MTKSEDITIGDISHVLAIEHDIVISKRGDLSLLFLVELPEIFRLSSSDYDLLNATFAKAVNILPAGYIFQRTDFCYPEETSHVANSASYLDKRDAASFGVRKKVTVDSYFTITKVAKLEEKTHFNSFFNSKSGIFKEPQYDHEALGVFVNEAVKFMSTVSSCFTDKLKNLSPVKLTGEEAYQLIFNRFYTANLSYTGQGMSSDIDNNDLNHLYIGDNQVSVLSMNKDGYSPALFTTVIDQETEIKEVATIHISLLNKLAYKLDFPHIIHQSYHSLNYKTSLDQLEKKRLNFKSLSVGSSLNSKNFSSLTGFLDFLRANPQFRLCDHHFGIAVISPAHDKKIHQDHLNEATRLMDDLDIKYNKNNYSALNMYLSYCPSNANDVPGEERGRIIPEWGACFNLFERNQDTAAEGVLFAERRFNTPVQLDLWNYPGITNKNMVIFGPSGTGKSVLINHLIRHYLFQNYATIIVDKGFSYKKQAFMHDDQKALKSTYVEASAKKPLTFNPFLLVAKKGGKYSLNDDTEDDQDYVTVIVSLIFQAWRASGEGKKISPEENAVLIQFVKAYFLIYLNNHPQVSPSFTSFYHFSIGYFETQFKNIEHRTFDMVSFKLVLSMFVEGDTRETDGQYSYLFNCKENPDFYSDSFIVFELEYIQGNTVLYPITVLIIINIVLQKLIFQKGGSRRLAFILDEVWTVLSGQMGEFIKYMYKTCRKHGGTIAIATQDLSDISNSPLGDAILAQSDTKILLPQSSEARSEVTRVLALTDHQANLLFSLKNDQREIFFKFLDRAVVYRLRLSDQALALYMSSKEHNERFFKDVQDSGRVEIAVNNFVETKTKKPLIIE